MKKKLYDQPTLQVIKLQYQGALLEASKPDYDSESWSRESDLNFNEENL